MRLWPMESCRASTEKRKPLQLLTGFFGRRREKAVEQHHGSRETLGWLSHDEDEDSEGELLHIPEPRQALHSPYHARTIDQDMEHLRLSRQDNPFLIEVLESRECLYESSESLYEEKHLMHKENERRTAEHPLSLSEVHARLVRSPPPVMWTRSRNSEPSFLHLIEGGGKTDFPPAFHLRPSRSQSDKAKLNATNSPGQYSDSATPNNRHGSRIMESALEAISGRFNLSPQPRRRPKDHQLSSDSN